MEERWASDRQIVAYADILGYKAFTKKFIGDLKGIRVFEEQVYAATIGWLNSFYQESPEPLSSAYLNLRRKVISSIGIRVVSDNIIFFSAPGNITVEGSSVPSEERNRAIGYCIETLFVAMSNCYSRMVALTGCPLRGGVSIGFGYESERERFLFGLSEALNNAVKLEKDAKKPKILLDDKLAKYLNEISYPVERFFYKDEADNYCFDWYAGLINLTNVQRWAILRDVKNTILKNASINGTDESALDKLLYFSEYHNKKVTDSSIDLADMQINIGELRSKKK